ncbi:RNA-binding domain-containing protein [Rhizodiscina lignyota]|uniref:RNA-binding domain-containing protein n=1 Tax=Rhizodiscina lignyota TaxID=1504668 RepID=A0A9P4ILJ7_9PEZI|nr:RNA-binding domain-containing protein [Rhizodiscina lignyota]
MDRSLDDVISERQRENYRGGRGRRQYNGPRDGIKKIQQDYQRNIDHDWVHDRFDEDSERNDRRPPRPYRAPRNERRSPEANLQAGAKIRVDNLHYDLTEDDLHELFTRIGPISSIQLLYDRQDRSRGIAFVTYVNVRDAEDAIDQFDGANAKGQPIKLQLVAKRNPFDHVERPGRSLFDRIERRRSASPGDEDKGLRIRGGGRGARDGGMRHSDVSKPAPEHIDRYIPGQEDRRRSPQRRNRESYRGRGHGQRREGDRGGRGRRDGDGHAMVQGRPRKTQEELDAEMDDYFGGASAPNGGDGTNEYPAANGNGTAPAHLDGDIDMIE